MHPKRILDQLKIHPSKKLGQNFLIHDADAKRIADLLDCHRKPIACHPAPSACHPEPSLCHPEPLGEGSIFFPVIEIGPGFGIVSKFLAQKTSELILVEKDSRLASYLSSQLSFRGSERAEESIFSFSDTALIQVIHQDFLEYAFPDKKLIVVGNIPYNIASLILLKLIENKKNIEYCILMLPVEMAQKIMVTDGALYGVLSLTVQLDFIIEKSFKVNASRFYPKPDVDSLVIKLIPKRDILSFRLRQTFYDIIKVAFQNRRKMLRKTFSHLGGASKMNLTNSNWEALGINPQSRPQDLSLEDYIRWARNS